MYILRSIGDFWLQILVSWHIWGLFWNCFMGSFSKRKTSKSLHLLFIWSHCCPEGAIEIIKRSLWRFFFFFSLLQVESIRKPNSILSSHLNLNWLNVHTGLWGWIIYKQRLKKRVCMCVCVLTLLKSPANRAPLQLKNCYSIKKDDIKKELMISRSVRSAAAQSQQVFEKTTVETEREPLSHHRPEQPFTAQTTVRLVCVHSKTEAALCASLKPQYT